MTTSDLKRFAASIATLSRISDNTRSTIIAMLMTDRAITQRIRSYCAQHGLSHLLPSVASEKKAREELPSVALLQRWPSSRIVQWIDYSTPCCLHLVVADTTTYLSLAFGPHATTLKCQPISYSHAAKLAESIMMHNAFGILVPVRNQLYAVRCICEYEDGSIIAECYGLNNTYTIKQATPGREVLGES
jgi:hypothetical protein